MKKLRDFIKMSSYFKFKKAEKLFLFEFENHDYYYSSKLRKYYKVNQQKYRQKIIHLTVKEFNKILVNFLKYKGL